MECTFAGNVFVRGSEKLARHELPAWASDDAQVREKLADAILNGEVRITVRDDASEKGRFKGKDAVLPGGQIVQTLGKTGLNITGTFSLE